MSENALRVVGRFIRVAGEIISTEDISRVWHDRIHGDYNKLVDITRVSLKSQDQPLIFRGYIADEIWELLQLASDKHLDPHDKLRDYVAP